MSNGQGLTPEEQKVLSLILVAIGVILTILVFIIMLARFLFWASIILFFGSIIYLVIAIFIDVDRTKHEDYFEGVPHSLIAVGLIILFWVIAHLIFPIGYSELSYQILDWDQEYKETMSIPYQITIDTLNKTCQTIPTYDYCDTIINTYQTSQKIGGISNTARAIGWLFKIKLP